MGAARARGLVGAAVVCLGVALSACLVPSVSAAEAAGVALQDAREVPGWRVDRIGAVREPGPSELADGPDVTGDREIWLVPLHGRFGVGCGAGRCDLAGNVVWYFVDAVTGEVLGRQVRGVR